ncbi:MAG TPA: hypothetical protein VKV73_30800 [Chloroflexota bacterium]|nr:hypothetical protein [Chloroflexota bacterium]
MSTAEGPDVGGDARDGRGNREDQSHRGDRIGIGGGDDSVTRIQLAARWAESYGPQSDSLGAILKRFRAAYDYLDAVIHGVEPSDLDRDLDEVSRPLHQSGGAPSASPEPTPAAAEAGQSSSLPPAPTEPRAWG